MRARRVTKEREGKGGKSFARTDARTQGGAIVRTLVSKWKQITLGAGGSPNIGSLVQVNMRRKM